jgi:hypothetical protein
VRITFSGVDLFREKLYTFLKRCEWSKEGRKSMPRLKVDDSLKAVKRNYSFSRAAHFALELLSGEEVGGEDRPYRYTAYALDEAIRMLAKKHGINVDRLEKDLHAAADPEAFLQEYAETYRASRKG